MSDHLEPVAGGEAREAEYLLHLYITGATPNSTRAVQHLTDLCERYLRGRYELQIIDIYQQPALARAGGIVAAPTLVKLRPGLRCFLVGDLSERPRVLALLGLTPDPTDPYL